MLMLDTDVCVSLIRGKNSARIAWAMAHKPGEIAISVITLSELEFGVSNSSDPNRNRNALLQFLGPIQICDYSAAVAISYGLIRTQLKHSPIGPLDTLIAAHAMSLGLELATDNKREFSRVVGLKIAEIP